MSCQNYSLCYLVKNKQIFFLKKMQAQREQLIKTELTTKQSSFEDLKTFFDESILMEKDRNNPSITDENIKKFYRLSMKGVLDPANGFNLTDEEKSNVQENLKLVEEQPTSEATTSEATTSETTTSDTANASAAAAAGGKRRGNKSRRKLRKGRKALSTRQRRRRR